MNNDEIWQHIVLVHLHTKKLYILSEEINKKLNMFFQPIKEDRDAFEHVIRAKALELNMPIPNLDGDQTDEIAKNYDRALGHVYRGFFDVADYMSVIIRDRIQTLLEPYSNNAINSILPDYYPSIAPKLEEINKKIANIRCNKDISKDERIIEEVPEYAKTIEDLHNYHKEILNKINALEEFTVKERKTQIKSNKANLIIGIVSGLVIALIIWVIAALYQNFF